MSISHFFLKVPSIARSPLFPSSPPASPISVRECSIGFLCHVHSNVSLSLWCRNSSSTTFLISSEFLVVIKLKAASPYWVCTCKLCTCKTFRKCYSWCNSSIYIFDELYAHLPIICNYNYNYATTHLTFQRIQAYKGVFTIISTCT